MMHKKKVAAQSKQPDNAARNYIESVSDNPQIRSQLVSAALQLHVSEMLGRAFERSGLNKTQLAQRMDVSRARVSQILDDEPHNFTLDLIGRAAGAMGMTWSLTLKDYWSNSEVYADATSPLSQCTFSPLQVTMNSGASVLLSKIATSRHYLVIDREVESVAVNSPTEARPRFSTGWITVSEDEESWLAPSKRVH